MNIIGGKYKQVLLWTIIFIALFFFVWKVVLNTSSFFLMGFIIFVIFIVMFRYPTLGIYLVIVSSVFDRVSWEVKGLTVRIGSLMVVILFVAWLIRFLLKREKLFKTPVSIPIAALFFINLISSLVNSPILKASLQRCSLIAIIFLTYFVIVNLSIRRSDSLKKFIFAFLLVGVGESLYCCASMLMYLKGIDIGGIQLYQWGRTITTKGTFLEANLLGSYLAVIGIFLFTYLVSSRYRAKKKWLSIALVSVIFALVMSWTRGAWVAFLVGCISTLYLSFKNRIISTRAFAATGLIILVTLGIFGLVMAPQIEGASEMKNMFIWKLGNLFNLRSGTGAYRVQEYSLAISHWKGHPLLGWGTDSFKVLGETRWIASSILHTLHDTGIIGLLIFVWLILKVLFSGLKALRITRDVFLEVNLIAFISSFLGLVIAYQLTSALWLPFPWVHLGLMMALVKIAGAKKLENKIAENQGSINNDAE